MKDLSKDPYGQHIDNTGRRLVANGYLHSEDTAIMRVWNGEQYDEEEIWTLYPEAVPPGAVQGSYLRLFEDGQLELFAPVWTAEEIAEIKENAERFNSFFDLSDKD